ncbi:hypothetical protein NM208_g223 [Fusarium decemcellulare]|uniref:Uncharacterized protein n=1 Tax=Fusarium decemcellulare TaxID=57161 RepID=A0ACC1T0M5_9HYPO|nr:hypothetical protein NM208_g223 [Fusarium decemcellulare]
MAAEERTQDSSGAFYDLPIEILTMIAGEVAGPNAENRDRHWYRDLYTSLKNLRLTHQRFADLNYINTILFTSLQLEPTQAGVRSLQRGDVSRVSEYVHSITFITPPSWALLFETFSYIVTVSALKERAKQFEVDDRPSYFPRCHFEKSLQEKFVNEHLGGQWPISEAQLREGFAAYMRDAEITKDLLEKPEGPLKEALVDLLGKVGNRLRKVRFINHECEEMRQTDYYDTPKSDFEPPCRLGSHIHSDRTEEYGCLRATAVAGECLFTMAMTCLAESGIAIRQLSIKHQMTGNFSWDTAPYWKQLDLNSVDKLKFTPGITLDDHGLVKKSVFNALPSLKDDEIEQRSSDALHSLVEKSRGSLQRLKINVDGPMTWPSRPASFDMPALEHINFEFNGIHTALLEGWMARMPKLQHLGMLCSRLSRGLEYREWVHLFDAIRDHPNVVAPDAAGLHLDFEQIITCDWTEISYGGLVRLYTKGGEKRSRDVASGDRDDVDEALEKHWYGVPYRRNRVLRYWLQDEDEDDEEDDDDDDEGSDELDSSEENDDESDNGANDDGDGSDDIDDEGSDDQDQSGQEQQQRQGKEGELSLPLRADEKRA